MTIHSDTFNKHAELSRHLTEKLNRDDLNFAIAGVDVGRMRKHLPGSEIDPLTGRKRDRVAEAMQRTLDWLLANDPAYAVAHTNLMNSLRDAQVEAERVLNQLYEQLFSGQDHLQSVLSNAARLPDGRAAFKYADGVVRDEDGHELDAVLAATIEWRANMPSGEEYDAAKERVQSIENAILEVQGIQTDLGDVYNRAMSEDNPLATTETVEAEAETVDRLRERLGEIEANITSEQAYAPLASLAVNEATTDASLATDNTLPKIGGH